MGNEQGVPYSQQNASKFQNKSAFDFESLIVIRGEPQTGKSTLVSRMKGQRFDPTYNPTQTLQVYQFPWKLNSSHCNNVMISIWDVVEHSSQSLPKNSYCVNNDQAMNSLSIPAANKPVTASDIDTKRANGLVILIDTRKESTIELADKLICEAPEECQIVVFSNFYGEPGATPVIPKKLTHHIGRFSFIVGNLKTNLGLQKLARWLQLPLLAAKRKMYADLFRATDTDLHNLEDAFESDCKTYTDLDQAQAKIQQSRKSMVLESYSSYDAAAAQQNSNSTEQQNAQPTRKPMPFYNNTGNSSNETSNTTSSTGRKPMPFYNNTGNMNQGNNAIDDNDDDFWNDDDNSNEIALSTPKTATKNNLAPNPMVQAAVPKKSFKQIVEENTTKAPEQPSTNEIHQKKIIKKKHHKETDSNQQNEIDKQEELIHNDPNAKQETPNQQPTYMTTLILEEEDEEENNEQLTQTETQPNSTQPVYESEIHQSDSNIVIQQNDKEIVENDEDFWSNDDNEEQDEMKCIENNADEPNEEKSQGNPLVQQIKPKANPYKNIIPHESEQSAQHSEQTTELKPNPLVQKAKIEKPNPYQNVIPNQQQVITNNEQNNQQQVIANNEQSNQQQAITNNNDEDDFWNFTPESITPTVVRTAQPQQQQQSVKKRKVETGDKAKARPLVIPKSQVQQRTITVSSKTAAQANQNKPTQKVPVIDTVDLFSDMDLNQQNDFFSAPKPKQQYQTPPQQQTTTSPTNKTVKIVKKRKRIVKSNASAASNNQSTTDSNYDTL